jgi:hypothetical protein
LISPEVEGAARLWVLDGWRTVAELDARGATLHKHTLDLPEQSGISFLRTAVNKAGERTFVGSALLGQKLFVFDEAWKTKLSYPPDDQPHEGLHAVELVDLGGDGTPEIYAGFWSLVGVQRVSLAGKREWSNRVVPTVLSLTPTPDDGLGARQIIATGDRGVLYRVNQYGHHEPKVEVAGRQVHRLVAAKFGEAATAYCGISYQADGRLLAIGLDAELTEVWSYPLPAGQFNNQIEYVTSGQLLTEAGEWYLAGPDGSVHIIGADGEFADSFATGELLTGLAVTKFGDASVILTANKTQVTAWKVTKP